MYNVFYYDTLVGKITIVENGNSITHLKFGEYIPDLHFKINETRLLKICRKQLEEYFKRKRKNFDLPLSLEGTEFQLKVWKALQEIPYGQTCSYKDIAKKINNPKASRAVGMANNKNPISIIIPCHRVIGSKGNLVGYRGGLDIKEKLLYLEKSRRLY
ncbi:methylated-DNA--[protein]-cysteine S-methyltransferase [Defluviitalea phaphyphila]|uniref:methylated-DNA--[protein]-cysteine S-methyltransferase n=1 Tax=Defluviitalea phaphyphila TaxID=1473580 RepID=UPI0007307B67|nr:methylated-DNA--[protein]-cysteine S-methyltransferase [Defluviitalea phaphyphila]